MTIVNHTSGTHSGLLVTGTGDDIEIDLEVVGGRTLRMSAGGDELGAWPIEECYIEPDPERQGSFRLIVDGEDAGFTPTDPTAFRALIDRVVSETADSEVAAFHETPSGDAPAADDPVAFLFGSAPPPTPVTTELPDFDAYDQETDAPVAAEESQFDDGPVAEIEDDVEDVEPVIAGAVVDHHDTEPVTTDLEAYEPGIGRVEDPESEVQPEPDPEPEPDAEPEPVFEREPFAPFEHERAPFEDESDLTQRELTDGEVGDRGSALDRLSAAIGSLRSSSDGEDEIEMTPRADEEYELGPNTVATDVLETQRALREHRMKEVAKGKWLKAGLIVVGLGAVIALFAFLTPRAIDFLQNYESEPDSPVTTEAAEVTTTTLAPTTTVASDDTGATTPAAFPTDEETIFDRPSPEFVAAWETAGGSIDEVLLFEQLPQLGPFEERFTPFLSMTGVVQPDGTLNEFQLVIDPTGPAEYDRIGIQALGVAIATVDPERSPEGRATLLGQLGLNVRQPQLDGIDGATEAAGIAYSLVYDSAANLLTMTVSPAG